MSNLNKLITGTLLVTSAAYIAAPATAAPTPPTDTTASPKTCEAAVLPGQEGVADQHWVSAIDPSGTWAAGGSVSKDGVEMPTLWNGDKIVPVEIPDVGEPQFSDVNSKGQAVGEYVTHDGHNVPFVYADGKVTPLDIEGRLHGSVAGINDAGTIAGSIANAPKEYIPVTWDVNDPTAKPHHLELPEGTTAGHPLTLDEAGNMAGTVGNGDGEAPMSVWKNGVGKPEEQPVPEGADPAMAINDYQEGWGITSAMVDGRGASFLYAPGKEPVEHPTLEKPWRITREGWTIGVENVQDDRTFSLASPDGQVTPLPMPDGYNLAEAHGITADASVIVGTARGDGSAQAGVRWTCK